MNQYTDLEGLRMTVRRLHTWACRRIDSDEHRDAMDRELAQANRYINSVEEDYLEFEHRLESRRLAV